MTSVATQNNTTAQIMYQNGNPNTGISLCIPHVFHNITSQRIKSNMIQANIGFIERVDLVPIPNKNYNKAFIHIRPKCWNMRSEYARKALTTLQEGQPIEIAYDDGRWFWKIYLSKSPKPTKEFNARAPMRRKKRLDLGEDIKKTHHIVKTDYINEKQMAFLLSLEHKMENQIGDNIKKFNLNDPWEARVANNYHM